MRSARLLLLSLFSFFFLQGVAGVVGQDNSTDPDAWETRANQHQPPEKVMDAIGVEAGMIVAEVGAGRGRYVVQMAARVGDTGRVYANDIDEEKLEYLRERCRRDGITNVETILGEVEDPLLPGNTLDLVYLINTYHDLDKPVELIQSILDGAGDYMPAWEGILTQAEAEALISYIRLLAQ